MHYAWFIWGLLSLGIWLGIYTALDTKDKKHEMLVVSLWTALAGLTEPLFVPAYWAPPTLFDLGLATGFDVESLIFSFGTGGIATVIYERVFRTRHRPLSEPSVHSPRHRHHVLAIASTPVVFTVLLWTTTLNPIYDAITALLVGGLSVWYCRPDLKHKMLASAGIFLALYFVYFLTLIALYPGYVKVVWNLSALSGVLIFGVPLEELLFAASFGFLWSGIYEHIRWRTVVRQGSLTK